MKNIQDSSSANYNVHRGTYSGKNRDSKKSSQPESSQKTVLLNKVKSSPNNDSSFSSKTRSQASSSSTSRFTTSSSSTSYNSKLSEHPTRSMSIYSDSSEKKKDVRSQSYSGSYSREQSRKKSEVDHLLSRSQRDLPALPLIPRIAKDWLNYPYVAPGASRVGNTYPSSSRSIQIVPGWQHEGGCGVACVAMATGRSYEECREQAVTVGNFHPAWGMAMTGICKTLQSLGTNAQMRHFSTWDDLPDLAIVAVWVGPIGHAVIFKRKNGKGYIFDRNAAVPLSPERYKFMENQCVAVSKDKPATAPKPAPAPKPPPAPPQPWGKSIIDRIDKEFDEAFGIIDDQMKQCFEAIDRARRKYIE